MHGRPRALPAVCSTSGFAAAAISCTLLCALASGNPIPRRCAPGALGMLPPMAGSMGRSMIMGKKTPISALRFLRKVDMSVRKMEQQRRWACVGGERRNEGGPGARTSKHVRCSRLADRQLGAGAHHPPTHPFGLKPAARPYPCRGHTHTHLGYRGGAVLEQREAEVLLDGGDEALRGLEHRPAVAQQDLEQLQRQHLQARQSRGAQHRGGLLSALLLNKLPALSRRARSLASMGLHWSVKQAPPTLKARTLPRMVVSSLPGAASVLRMDSLQSARNTRKASFCSCDATVRPGSWATKAEVVSDMPLAISSPSAPL